MVKITQVLTQNITYPNYPQFLSLSLSRFLRRISVPLNELGFSLVLYLSSPQVSLFPQRLLSLSLSYVSFSRFLSGLLAPPQAPTVFAVSSNFGCGREIHSSEEVSLGYFFIAECFHLRFYRNVFIGIHLTSLWICDNISFACLEMFNYVNIWDFFFEFTWTVFLRISDCLLMIYMYI